MKIFKLVAIATLLVSSAVGAVGVPVDFSKWAKATLDSKGMPDARIVETKYPFYFTFCEQNSTTLWRYDVMAQSQIEAAQRGETMRPVTEDQRTVEVEADSALCK